MFLKIPNLSPLRLSSFSEYFVLGIYLVVSSEAPSLQTLTNWSFGTEEHNVLSPYYFIHFYTAVVSGLHLTSFIAPYIAAWLCNGIFGVERNFLRTLNTEM